MVTRSVGVQPDSPLREYRAKRDFSRTREPEGGSEAGKPSAAKRLSYVIQKHAASHLHYDFRLELDGVLLSWAVPKGPSLDPSIKRLAMPTEDHPLPYGTFEGTIPAGEYGGGTVMVWDQGSWSPEGDPRAAYAKGNLTFELFGEKLRGRWHLVRSHRSEKRPSWILFKAADSESSTERDITSDAPDSAKSGRTLDEIAAAKRGSVWQSNRTDKTKSKLKATSRPSSRKRVFPPKDVAPMMAKLAKRAPVGAQWAHEPKFDGVRALITRVGGHVEIEPCAGRTGPTPKALRHLAGEIASLDWPDAVVDGELVTLHDDGTPDSGRLKRALAGEGDARLIFYAFDLLFADGVDLRARPFLERKQSLEAFLGKANAGVRFLPCTVGRGSDVFARACALGLPAVVSKKVASKYQPGVSGDWIEVACSRKGAATPTAKMPGARQSDPAMRTPSNVRLTHPERVLWTDPATSKGDLARYYELVADRLLPHVANRPLTLVRCPNGFGKPCFFQKHATDDQHRSIAAIDVRSREDEPYMAIGDTDGLRALVQMSVLEIHTWGCHISRVDRPDWWVFDLDPDTSVTWDRVVDAAFEIRKHLAEVQLESWVKTTGGKGLHVCVPVAPGLDWEETKALCAAFANAMVRRSPAEYVATITKAKRHGKILIDHFRNGRGATAVAPYSTRARPGAPVAMPLTWKELGKTRAVGQPTFDVAGVLARGLPKIDPWNEAAEQKQSIGAAAQAYLPARRRHA